MPNLIKLTKGEILIREDDVSNSLFFVQSGSFRVFKKKGKGFIELGVINPGSIVGELSFFDNQRRSASVEAMRDCEVIEVPRFNFEEYMTKQPAWANALLKTMSSKVRDLTDHVRELENNSTITKLDADNKTYREHEFLLARDVMKLCSALIVCATLRGTKDENGWFHFPATLFQTLATNVNSVPLAKISSFLDILKELELLAVEKAPGKVLLVVRDLPTLDQFLFWLTEDVAKPSEDRMSLSRIGLELAEAIWSLENIQKGFEHREYQAIDLPAVVQQLATRHTRSANIYLDCFGEIASLKLGREVKSADGKKEYEIYLRRFLAEFPMLRIRSKIDVLNEKKRGEGA